MYVQNKDLDLAAGDHQGHKLWDLKSGWARSYASAEKFIDIKRSNDLIDGDLKVHRKIMQGTYKNEDQFISRQDLKTSSLGSTDSLSFSTALAMGSVGLGSVWFLNRRERVMSTTEKRKK